MTSYILFRVNNLKYAFPLENIHRIDMAKDVTKSNSGEKTSEGIMSFEDDVIEIFSFRAMIGAQVYSDYLKALFEDLKGQHKAWVDALIYAVENSSEFTKTTNPHMCHLGKWIDSFNPYSDEILNILNQLSTHHKKLHSSAIDVLEKREKSLEEALDWIHTHVKDIYTQTIWHIEEMAAKSDVIAHESQKLMIVLDGDNKFGIHVDSIDDIVHIEDQEINSNENLVRDGEYLRVGGVLKHKDELSSLITKIKCHSSLKE